MIQNTAIIILAAGSGSRFSSSIPKPLVPIFGMPMIQHLLNNCPPDIDSYIVIQKEQEKRFFSKIGKQNYLYQKSISGTARAISENEHFLSKYDACLILNGDAPFIPSSLIAQCLNSPKKNILVGFKTGIKNQYGQIQIHNNEAIKIVEASDRTEDVSDLFYSGIMKLSKKYLAELKDIRPSPKTKEYYITNIVSESTPFDLEVAPEAYLHGINTQDELKQYEKLIRQNLYHTLTQKGILFSDFDSTLLHPGVIIGQDTLISSHVSLTGKTSIGRNSSIGQGSVIHDTHIADNCTILPYSILTKSSIGAYSTTGPFAHIIESTISHNAYIGNYVEVKRSRIESGVKAKHLSYLGDAYIDKNANISAGVITCNYAPWKPHKMISYVGTGAFVGAGCLLIAPAHIGEQAICAAGTVITEYLLPNSFAITRPKLVTKLRQPRTTHV